MTALRVLVCDDEPGVRFALREAIADRGHEVVLAESGAAALDRLEGVDAIVTDLAMPGMDGLTLLREVRSRDPHLPVIVVTARGSERVAVEAMKAGAHDYLAKPFDIDELGLVVERAAETGRLRRGARFADAERALGRFVLGESAVMRRLMTTIERVARRDITTLVRGETGTGKELFASMLHALSPRASKPLVRFNAAAVPAELAEAELFGHARGAFTGAKEAREGFFARANGGTLVLDEIGELPIAVQPKLLRALQEGEIQPLGAARTQKVDVRIVACTHRDLLADTKTGRFREDLYYRLAVIEIEIPPLRDHREDIPTLARAFAARFADRFHVEDVTVDDALAAALAARDWPGNVRELENAIARMVALSDGGPLRDPSATPTPANFAAPAGFRAQVEAFERSLITAALDATKGNRAEAARRLGLSRVTLLDRMKRLGIS